MQVNRECIHLFPFVRALVLKVPVNVRYLTREDLSLIALQTWFLFLSTYADFHKSIPHIFVYFLLLLI